MTLDPLQAELAAMLGGRAAGAGWPVMRRGALELLQRLVYVPFTMVLHALSYMPLAAPAPGLCPLHHGAPCVVSAAAHSLVVRRRSLDDQAARSESYRLSIDCRRAKVAYYLLYPIQ